MRKGLALGGVLLSVLIAPFAQADDYSPLALDPFTFGRSARLDAIAAGVALPGDASSLIRNPATIADIRSPIAAAHYQDWYVDTYAGHVGFAAPSPWFEGSLALDIVYLSEGEVWDLDFTSGQYDESYQNSTTGVAVGYGVTTPWWDNIDAGLSLQLSRRTLVEETAGGVTAGAGLVAGFSEDHLRLAFSVRNVGAGVSFNDGESDPAPRSVTLGACFELPEKLWESVGFTLCADLTKLRGYEPAYQIGVEAIAFDVLAIRVGHDTSVEESGTRYGLGVVAHGFGFDYAYMSHEALGSTNSVSLTYRGEE